MEVDVFGQDSQVDIFRDTNDNDSEVAELTAHCLECHGDMTLSSDLQDIADGGLLRCKELQTLFRETNYHSEVINIAECSVKLFGYIFDPGLAILEKQDVLFQMARKLFVKLESDALKINASIGVTQRTETCDYFKLRQHLCLFFSFLRSFLLSIPSSHEFRWLVGEITPLLVTHLREWRLMLQGFSRLPNFVISNCSSRLGNKCVLASHHLFHAHLELRWYHLNVLFAMEICETNGNPGSNHALESSLVLFLTELVKLTEGCFSALHGIDKLVRNSPFPCTCVQEMWLLLQLLADKLYFDQRLSQPFWGLMDKLLRTCLPEKKAIESEPPNCSELLKLRLGQGCDDFPLLCLWLYLHLARLYGFSESGLYMDVLRSAPVQESCELLECVLRNTLPNDDVKEARLREVMRALLVLPSWWSTGTPPLLVLWEVFLRRINSAFLLPTETPNMLAVMSKNASGFASQVKQNLNSTERFDETDNSYSLFLKLLGRQVGSALSGEEAKQRSWKQLKGRIYPKFPETRMQTLSELGLHHLTSLMLTMAQAVDIDEVGDKMQQMLSFCHSRESGKRAVIWRAHLTLLLLRAERGLNLATTAEGLIRLVEKACSNMTVFSTAETELMRMFIEALHDIAEATSTFSPAVHTLISDWVSKYLAVCNTSDLCRTLDAMQALANKLPSFNEDLAIQSEEMSVFARLKEYAMPCLVMQSQTPNCPVQKVSDLAVSLTLAADNIVFTQLFNHFVTSDNVNVRVTARYLTQFLPNEDAMERTRSKVPNHHNIIIQAWVKCCLLAGDSRSELNQLTSVVARLPQMISLCGDTTDLLIDSEDPLSALAQILSSRLLSLQNLREKQQLKDQTLACLGRIDKVAEAALKYGKLTAPMVLRLYLGTGNLVQNCALLLYVKAQSNCLMKGLISQLLLPMSLRNSDTKLMPDVAAALRQTLPMFMRGITSLGIKHDAYVARTIRELTEQYVFRLAPSEHGKTHPLMVCFVENTELSTAMLDAMKATYFLKRGKLLVQGAAQALRLVQQLVLEHGDNEGLVFNLVQILLEHLLVLMLFLEDNSQGKSLVAETIKEIVNAPAFRDNPDIQEVFNSKMPLVFRNLGFHAIPLFRILQWLATMRRGLLLPSVPALRAEVAKVENLRGSGRDASLRNALEKLEGQLGYVAMDT